MCEKQNINSNLLWLMFRNARASFSYYLSIIIQVTSAARDTATIREIGDRLDGKAIQVVELGVKVAIRSSQSRMPALCGLCSEFRSSSSLTRGLGFALAPWSATPRRA